MAFIIGYQLYLPKQKKLDGPLLERKAAKISRKTFSRNQIITPSKNEFIPEQFQDPFCKDVTPLYNHSENITIHVDKRIANKARHIYLSVFNNLVWPPVVGNRNENNKVEFCSMAKNNIYLPTCYKKRKVNPIDYPFILDPNGK